jgi:hypothetical protein
VQEYLKSANDINFLEKCINLEPWPICKEGVFQIGWLNCNHSIRLCYLMKGHPNEWPILVSYSYETFDYIKFDMGLVDFLLLQFESYPKYSGLSENTISPDRVEDGVGIWEWK